MTRLMSSVALTLSSRPINQPARFILAVLTLVALLLGLRVPLARADGIIVTSAADTLDSGDGQCTLREAILNANNNDQAGSIDCAPGGGSADIITFADNYNITLTAALPVLSNTLTLDSAGRRVTVSGNNAQRVFRVEAGAVVTMSHLSIMRGRVTGNGSGILNEGTLTLLNSTLNNNVANNGTGGGIHNTGTLTVTNSTLSSNSANNGGGIHNTGTLMVTNSTFSNDSANNGGGIRNTGTLHLRNTLIANSPNGGDCSDTGTIATHLNNLIEDGSCNTGATGLVTGDPNLEPLQDNGGTTLTHALQFGSPAIDTGDNGVCPATDQRGVARPIGPTCDIGAVEALPCAALPPVTVTTAGDSGPGSLRQALSDVCDGGTIDFAPSLANQTIGLTSAGLSIAKTVTLTNPNAANLKISGNNTVRVFEIQAEGVVTMSNLRIINGSIAENGGGIRNSGTLTLLGSTLSGNSATLSGGGIDNLGTLTVTNSTLNSNTAGVVGGGIANGGTLTLLNSTLSGNSAPAGGGGIDNLGTLAVLNSTLSGNSASTGNGGGIFNSSNTLILLNSTLSGNSANTGGGIDNAGTLTATNSTLSGNSATSGGGIRNSAIGSLYLRNSLIANSLNGGDCVNTGTLASHLNNLIEDGSCSTGAVGFVTGDPKLGSLQYNGGPSTGHALLTHALLSGSPAIDAGDNGVCPATDQRGVARPDGPACDIGAFEALPCTADLTVITANDSGPGSLRQALVDVCGGGTIDFDSSLANQTISLTSTELSIAQTVTLTNPNAPNLQVSGNEAHRVFNIQAGTVVISNLGIINGAAGEGGGGILVGSEAELTLLNSSLSGNSAGLDGGGINNSGTLTVTNSPVSDNSAGGSGGGIHNVGMLTIAGSTLSDNSANNSGGGGIANFGGTLTLLNITLSDNSANNSGGGGLANFEGTLTLLSSTLSGNSADTGGGLINSGTLTLLNSTFSGNSADTGGGISNSGTLTMTNSTLNDNSADTGGGIDNSGSLHLSNSLIANSPDGGDCNNTGAIVTHLNNLIEDGSCETGAINLVTGDPNLGPLQDNGGPSTPAAGQVTLTHALLDGSPAIDAGDNLICPATDQRGVTRPIGLACDIGAFEAGSTCFLAVTVTSSGDDGPGSLRRALTEVCDGGTIDFAASLANQTISLTSTELSITKTMTLTNPNAANLKISGNEAHRVFNIQAGVVMTISHLGIISGTTNERGGGILNDGTLTLLNSTLTGNSANDQGGGIRNNGTLTLVNSTLSDNWATGGGGIDNSGTLALLNSTLSGNLAFDDGGLFNIGGGLLNNFGGSLHLQNSLIANSPSGGDCDNLGIIVTHLNTLIEDGSCSSGAAGFVTGDPHLGPLQDNGGQTLTHALLPGSPAIDAGDNTVCPATDQRDVARPVGSGCDLGAYEAQAQTLPAATLYLPLVLKSVVTVTVTGPDLVVDSLAAAGSSVTLVIKNQGDAPVVDAFWVDVYLNPTTAPTGVNQEWHELGSQGLVWGIVGSALPLDPGESLTLTIGDPFYRADLSSFTAPLPAGSPVYAQVDSANLLTDYGGVLEDHEISGGAYNNITATTASKGEAGPAAPGAGAAPPSTPDQALPSR